MNTAAVRVAMKRFAKAAMAACRYLLLIMMVLALVLIAVLICDGSTSIAKYATCVQTALACGIYAHALACMMPRTAPDAPTARRPLSVRIAQTRRTLLVLFVIELVLSTAACLAYVWTAQGMQDALVPMPGFGIALTPGLPDAMDLAALLGNDVTPSTSPAFLLDAPLGIAILLLAAIETELRKQG